MARWTSNDHLLALATSGVGGLVLLHWWGLTYGSSRAEREKALPGDDLVARPQTVATHARTIKAPPARVWPWLTQVGWHRAGWYTPRWVDVLLFPDNAPSGRTVRNQRSSTQFDHGARRAS